MKITITFTEDGGMDLETENASTLEILGLLELAKDMVISNSGKEEEISIPKSPYNA